MKREREDEDPENATLCLDGGEDYSRGDFTGLGMAH